MKIKFRNIIRSLFAFGFVTLMVSCSQDEPNKSPFVNQSPDDPGSTILVYSVATNSLSSNLVSDKAEMVKAAENIDLSKNNILLFQAVYEYDEKYVRTGKSECKLLKLVQDNSCYGWETIKEFDSETAPLNPIRISEVIDYSLLNYPAESYGLIFWSHSTASDPYFPTKSSDSETMDHPMCYSFGQDLTIGSGYEFYQVNVDDLASAVPDNTFNFIWFDSCYMSNIETIYQFRNKCKYFVGYPTEVCDDGMPYHYTLPLLASEKPDVVAAADRLFDYYQNEYRYQIATIAVVDMNKIDSLMRFCREIYEGNSAVPSTLTMHKYTNNRQSSGPFYDLGDYTKAIAQLKAHAKAQEDNLTQAEMEDLYLSNIEWQDCLAESVVYKAATTYDFNGKKIDQDSYSGISSYVYNIGSSSQKELFFESLDWFKAVYP